LLTGALYYNTTTQTMKVYDGANWITATAAGTTALLTYKYVATAGQTTFSGAASVGGTLSYTSNNIIVFVNGVSLDSTDYTATNGTSVVLASGAALNDEVVIVAFKSFTVADTYTKGEVDAFAVKLTGAQTVAGVKTFSSQPVFSAGIDLSSNGQVKFPASQNASSDANTLDDYEEGSWTPIFQGSGADPTSVSYATQRGTYTKIGNRVFVDFYLSFTTFTGGSNAMYIGGLPFAGSGDGDGALKVENVSFTAGKTYATASISGAFIVPNHTGSSTTWNGLTIGTNVTSSGSTKYFTGSLTYKI
jgi:hypothetical protein